MLLPSRCCEGAVPAVVAIAVSAPVGVSSRCSGSSSGRGRGSCGVAAACGGCPCCMCARLKSAQLLLGCLQRMRTLVCSGANSFVKRGRVKRRVVARMQHRCIASLTHLGVVTPVAWQLNGGIAAAALLIKVRQELLPPAAWPHGKPADEGAHTVWQHHVVLVAVGLPEQPAPEQGGSCHTRPEPKCQTSGAFLQSAHCLLTVQLHQLRQPAAASPAS